MAASDATDARAFMLRDGRVVTVAQVRAAEAADVERLIAAADAAREELYSQSAGARGETEANGVSLSAHDVESGELIGVVAYTALGERHGELAGVVDPRFRGLGLGTLLLHLAVEHATDSGLETLQVDLQPGSEDIAEMLRDAGLAAHWDIDYPVTRVTLTLGSERPGWATPRRRAD
jgi:GNAT superfamily N-acetyltransferase